MDTIQETKESPPPRPSSFEKLTPPDLKAVYSAEKIEVVPYVTLWEGEVEESECLFEYGFEPFRTAEEIEQIRDDLIEFQTKGKTYRDDPKSRLKSVEVESDGRLRLEFRPVRYSDYVITNNSMEIKPQGWLKTIRQVLEPGPNLTPLEESLCSNHLGISCLVITKDRKIILNQGSQQKITGAGQISSSASGAMDWKEPFVTPFDVMQAELYEEIGLDPDETVHMKAIAIARELARGGKPEMVFLLETKLTSDEILSRLRSDPDKEVEKVFAVDLPEGSEERKQKLQELWELSNTAQSTKAALYYLSKKS